MIVREVAEQLGGPGHSAPQMRRSTLPHIHISNAVRIEAEALERLRREWSSRNWL